MAVRRHETAPDEFRLAGEDARALITARVFDDDDSLLGVLVDINRGGLARWARTVDQLLEIAVHVLGLLALDVVGAETATFEERDAAVARFLPVVLSRHAERSETA